MGTYVRGGALFEYLLTYYRKAKHFGLLLGEPAAKIGSVLHKDQGRRLHAWD